MLRKLIPLNCRLTKLWWCSLVMQLFTVSALLGHAHAAESSVRKGQPEKVAQVTVSGTVTSADDGETLPGVNILEKGTTNGVVTDVDGQYRITVQDNATLIFSSVGYATEEIEVGNQTVIDVSLNLDVAQLGEVIVIGYGEAKKSDVTGAVVRADIESLKEQPNINILQSLQGNVPGLNVGVATSAGETPTFSIRGQNSLSGSNEPLIVVDGIIYRGNLRDINTNDVASIDVLKDASSAAIYGSQAANGVIIITTKSGKSTAVGDKPTFNYSGSFGISEAANVPEYYDREGYIGLFEKMWWRDSRTGPDYLTPNPDFDPVVAGNMTAEMEEALDEGYGTDWWDLITQKGFIQTHTLSMRGNTRSPTTLSQPLIATRKILSLMTNIKK